MPVRLNREQTSVKVQYDFLRTSEVLGGISMKRVTKFGSVRVALTIEIRVSRYICTPTPVTVNLYVLTSARLLQDEDSSDSCRVEILTVLVDYLPVACSPYRLLNLESS